MPSLIELFFSPIQTVLILIGVSTYPLTPITDPQALQTSLQAPSEIHVQVEGSEASSVGASAGASATPARSPSPLCGYQHAGGETLKICSVLGYQMPEFIFYASLAILGFFMWSSVSLLRQSRGVARSLRRLNHALSSKSDTFESTREAMTRERLVAETWKQFEQTLIRDGSEVYRTVPAESILTRREIVERNIRMEFYQTVPGLLTGFGLLMTFVAILDGLSSVSVGSNLEVQGIAGLINGLSGKFFSSVVALGCSVAFVLIERLLLHPPSSAHLRMISLLDRHIPLKTLEQLLFQMLQGRR